MCNTNNTQTMPAESEDQVPPLHVRWDGNLRRRAQMASGAEDKNLSEYVRDLIRDDADEKGIQVPNSK